MICISRSRPYTEFAPKRVWWSLPLVYDNILYSLIFLVWALWLARTEVTIFELRGEWRRLHRMPPPMRLSRDLLIRGIIYQLRGLRGGRSRAHPTLQAPHRHPQMMIRIRATTYASSPPARRPCWTGCSGALSGGTSAKSLRKSVSSLMKSSPPSAIPGAFRHPNARLRRATASRRGRPQPNRC